MRKAQGRLLLMSAGSLTLAAWFAGCQGTPSIAAELRPLQGHWEGEGAGGKCTIVITGDSLRYCAGTTCYETTFTLPPGTNPQQLHATIKGSSPPSNDVIGKMVFAIFKIEDGTLTLAVGGADEAPKTFDEATAEYVVRQVPPKT
jgi:uncharacterized protein (TIGR03067 family)